MLRAMITGLLLFYSLTSFAEVKTHMDQILQQIFTLKPYIVSPVEYSDPKNAETIQGALKKMVDLSEKVSHEGMIQKTGFAASSRALTQQLREAELVYRVGNKDYSLWMLRSTLSVCMSCHTQLPSTSTKFEFYNKDRFLTKPFDEAEFLFIVRNYDKAMPLYDQVLAKYPDDGVTTEKAEKALSRKIYYFTRVKRDFGGLAKSLADNGKNKKLPDFMKKRINGLINAAKKEKDKTYPEFKSEQTAELRKYAQANLKDELDGDFEMTPEQDLKYLKTSSVLYKFLEQNPETTLKPEILYWLSFCERRYEETAFYSMPEMYLKQCVLEHPESNIAPSCLKEYQELVSMAYTGSSGTHIPEDVEKEIQTMKDLVKKMNGKKKEKSK